jgi:hypothetical protein
MAPNNGELFCRLARQISALYTRARFAKRISLKKPILLETAILGMERHPPNIRPPRVEKAAQTNHIVV